jgi:hypothetical protein
MGDPFFSKARIRFSEIACKESLSYGSRLVIVARLPLFLPDSTSYSLFA